MDIAAIVQNNLLIVQMSRLYLALIGPCVLQNAIWWGLNTAIQKIVLSICEPKKNNIKLMLNRTAIE